jgi:D-alanyl-D-alanine carboxypeptidase (penicillin-binding protein 5/6)
MTFKRALSAVTIVLMLIAVTSDADAARRGRHAGVHRPAPHHAAPAPAQSAAPPGAKHVAIMDGDSGLLLYCDDCHAPIEPASMSKLMTALVVGEALQQRRISLDTRYHVSENAWRHGAMSDGSHMFLELNSNVSVRDLIAGVIVVSANDACITLAEGLYGSEAAFVEVMNKRARELGLTSAHFTNVTGLPDPNHVISTADLASLARWLMSHHPELYRLYSERTFTYNNHTQENRNPLFGAFDGADGVKTGHTDEAGYSLVGSALVAGHRRIVVFNGTRSMEERRSEGVRLMRAAFGEYGVLRFAEAHAQVGEAEVYMGARQTAPLVAPSLLAIGGPNAVLGQLHVQIRYNGPLAAPIKKGDVVAHLLVEGPPGFTTRSYPLVAGADIGRANWFARAWEGLHQTLSGAH